MRRRGRPPRPRPSQRSHRSWHGPSTRGTTGATGRGGLNGVRAPSTSSCARSGAWRAWVAEESLPSAHSLGRGPRGPALSASRWSGRLHGTHTACAPTMPVHAEVHAEAKLVSCSGAGSAQVPEKRAWKSDLGARAVGKLLKNERDRALYRTCVQI